MAKTVVTLTRGDAFGELAIVEKSRRKSSVIATERTGLLILTDDVSEISMLFSCLEIKEKSLKYCSQSNSFLSYKTKNHTELVIKVASFGIGVPRMYVAPILIFQIFV